MVLIMNKGGGSRESDFIHRFIPAATGAAGAPTLLLLHGTGGNEEDLLELGPELCPSANLLSPRGKVLENGMPRFFRRLAEGVFDEEDLRLRTDELAAWLAAAAARYGFDPGHIVAAGYSNGANIAGSLLLLHPHVLRGGILLRPMLPLMPETRPDLRGKLVFAAAGELDPIIPLQNTMKLIELLQQCGAEVHLFRQQTGHNLTMRDIGEAREWSVRTGLWQSPE